jgi:hypothetical protein
MADVVYWSIVAVLVALLASLMWWLTGGRWR